MASLAASLLALGLAAPDARAGSYTGIRTGGTDDATITPASAANFSTPQDASASAALSPGAGDGPGGNPNCAVKVNPGTITDAFTWTHGQNPDGTTQTDADDPPPSCVLVVQNSSALWYVSDEEGGGTGSGTADPGLSEGTVTLGTYGSNGPSLTKSATLYSQKSGASFSVFCTPTATFNGMVGTGTLGSVKGEASVNSIMTCAYPVTISLGGILSNPSTGQPILDSAGNRQVLTGQQLTATLNGIPDGFTVTKYTWGGVSGNCFKNYDPYIQNPANNQLAALGTTDLNGPATGSTSVAPLAFYDSAAENVTVTCAVTVLAPDGKTSLSLTVTAPTITVKKPTAYWTTNPDDPNSGPSYNLTPTGYIGYIEQWDASITVPAPFSGGSGCFAQIAYPTIDFQRTPTGSQPINCYLKELQTNADGTTSWVLPQTGLDTMFPYPIGPSTNPQSSSPYQNDPNGYMWDVSVPGKSVDTPSVGFGIAASDNGGNNWYDAFASGSFTTWLMYKPAGGVWVPLQRVDWSWTGHVVKDKATGKWNPATSGTQPVTGNTSNQGTNTNTPPQWTTINLGASVLRP